MSHILRIGDRVRFNGEDTGTVYGIRYDSRGEALIDVNVDPECGYLNDYYVGRTYELRLIPAVPEIPPNVKYVFVLYYRRTRLSNWLFMCMNVNNAPRHMALMARLIADIVYSNKNPKGLVGQRVFSTTKILLSADKLDNLRPNNPNVMVVNL